MGKGDNKKNPYKGPDRFTVAAKQQGYPARSVFKLEEIDRRIQLLKGGMRVLDLGATPGSWMLYAAQKIGRGGKLLAVDLNPIEVPIPENVQFFVGDALALDNEALAAFAPYDVVLSDMAPNTTGNRLGDQTRSFELFMRALAVAEKLGKPGGAFVGKIFMGEDFAHAKKAVKRIYDEERALRPRARAPTATSCSWSARTRRRSFHRRRDARPFGFRYASLVTVAAFQGLLAGRFIIEREVGRGGVGIVYRAMDEVTNAPVALKVIAIHGVDAGEEARFGREGRVLAGLSHPNIVRVVAFGQLDEGQPYVAMEWLDGEDIAQRQKRSPLTLSQAVFVAAQVADALAYAHGVGIVHRDIKPSNVILLGSRPGFEWPVESKLVDFGVASAEDSRLTRTGAIIGTPAYMAPEQARGDAEVDARSDIYGLGATLFEMIAGRPPHVGPTPVAILARLVTTPAPRLTEIFPEAPHSLDDLLSDMLMTHPEDRPARAAEVATRLRAIATELENAPQTTRTQSPDEPQSMAR